MSHTIMRQWAMLRMLPRSPKKISTREILNRLTQEGFQVEQRTVQRDLEKFTSLFPLDCDKRSKPYGWFWCKDAEPLDIPGLDSHTALAFYLAEQHLTPIMPRETVQKLTPHFRAAVNRLNHMSESSGAKGWTKKVRVLRQGPDLSTPEIDAEVQECVYSALLLNRRLEVEYKNREAKDAKKYTISPLGLVLKNGIFYIPCTIADYSDIRLLTLHRMRSASITTMMVTPPKSFDLDDYIESGELHFRIGDKIHLKAMLHASLAIDLYERKFDALQRLEKQLDGRFLLQAYTTDTSELRYWLRSLGEKIEVLAPAYLREDLYQSAKAMLQHYETT